MRNNILRYIWFLLHTARRSPPASPLYIPSEPYTAFLFLLLLMFLLSLLMLSFAFVVVVVLWLWLAQFPCHEAQQM